MRRIEKRIYLMSIVLLASCIKPKGEDVFVLLRKNNGFVDNRFIYVKPISRLINMGDYANLVDSFNLDRRIPVRVYATGEILLDLNDQKKRYLLQGDDIQMSIKVNGLTTNNHKPLLKKYIFSYASDTSIYKAEGIIFNWKNNNGKQYISEIAIPWKNLNLDKPNPNTEIRFDVAIGDNDDGFIQDKKISWRASSENIFMDNAPKGTLELTRNNDKKSNSILSIYIGNHYLTNKNKIWNNIPIIELKKSLLSDIKDSYDLSANVKSIWDKKNLYFLITVNDSRQKRIFSTRTKDKDIFIDKGWIENSKGTVVWSMNAKNSKWAGGAFKNQKIDTIIYLNKGKYKLRYITDENHSYKHWTAPAPLLPFYGIVIYDDNHR